MGMIYDYQAGARQDHPTWSETEIDIEAWLDEYFPGKKTVDDGLDSTIDAVSGAAGGVLTLVEWLPYILTGIIIVAGVYVAREGKIPT